MNLKYLSPLLWFLLPIHSCTNLSKMSDNQRLNGHYRLYTYPKKPITKEFDQDRYLKFALIGTNDLRGEIYPKQFIIPNRFNEKRILNIGGVSAIKTYKDILNKYYQNQTAFIDSGSFLNESNNHSYTIFLRNYLQYDVGNLGPKEFEIIPPNPYTFQSYIKEIFKKSQFPIVSTNLFDLQSADQINWNSVKTDFILDKEGLKIGFIGIITPQSAKNIPDRQINGLYFQNAAKSIITKAKNLKRQGANILVLMINGQIDCTSQLAQAEQIPEDKVNFLPFESYHCDTVTHSFKSIISQLPNGTVDVIFSNGANSKVANYINGIPVLQTMENGKFISWIEFVFDKKFNILDPEQTKIYQPVQLCHHFLKNSQDCYTKEDFSESELTPAIFLGEKVNIEDLPSNN